MSGGSYGYLYIRSEADVMSSGMSDLEAMAATLEEIAPGHPATVRTRALYEELFARVTHDRLADIRPVWHAVEWWRSCDWSLTQVDGVLAGYEAPA